MSNEICHVEIPILEKAKAKEFYQAVFEWKIDFKSLPDYGLVNRENGASIGLPIVSDLPVSSYPIYIEVDDIEAKLAIIEKAGGEILTTKSQISPEIGYSAKFKDCFGNQIGLFSRT
ncbi:MAG: VOC family protein [Candidatus Hodarchaeota archaeon]